MLKLTSWTTASGSSALTAPSIGSLMVAGGFTPALTLTGASKITLGSARITGSISGIWTITGNAGAINVGAVGSGVTMGISGALASMNVSGGGLPADVTAASIGSLNVTGDLTGDLTAGSAKNIKVTGKVVGAALTFTGPPVGTVVLNHLLVGGDFNTSSLVAAGDVLNITALSMTGSSVLIGTGEGANLTNANSGNLGTNKLGSIQLKAVAGTAFSNSTILADSIGSASLGSVATSNGGVPDGLAAASFKSIAATINNVAFHAGAPQLVDQSAFDSFLTSKGLTTAEFGDFRIVIA